MPGPLPEPAGISDEPLARRTERRVPDGIAARHVLPGLLLGADGVLFVVGVMNLAWVGVLTLFILAEKVGPAGARVSEPAAQS